jgi:hypothetical protein
MEAAISFGLDVTFNSTKPQAQRGPWKKMSSEAMSSIVVRNLCQSNPCAHLALKLDIA